jgi:PAS domain S-box-containing protein
MSDSDLRALVDDLDAVVWEADAEARTFTFVSSGAERLLGYPPDRWYHEPDFWIERVHPDDRASLIARSRQASVDGRPYELEYRVVAADGRQLWLRDLVTVAAGAGRPRLRGLLVDVTERRHAQEWLEQGWRRERELAERLRDQGELKNSVLTAVSHELRSPLSAILGIALTLERAGARLEPAETADLVARLATNARKLEHLLADLLDLDRLHRGIVSADRGVTDLGRLVRRVVDESGLAAERPVEVSAEPVVAMVDGAKLERIVDNLLINAIRHTPAGTPVWVRLRREGSGVLLAVDDAGPGIPAGLRRAVFAPFRRVQDGRPQAPGVGIGLSLVARFAELHGGRAWVEDRPGGGASFRVHLPDAVQPARTAVPEADPAA